MRFSLFGYLVIATFLGCASAQATQTAPVAQLITADNAAELVKGGPDAIGGIGDWHLSNGVICAIVSAVEHEHEFSAKGGVLVDLGFCDRTDDHYAFSQDLLDGSRMTPLDAVQVTINNEVDEASIIAISRGKGVEMETRYTLGKSSPTKLVISKRLQVIDEEQADFNLMSVGYFNYHSLESFVLDSDELANSTGFNNQDFVSRGISAMSESALDANTIITLSPPEAVAPVAYGWQLESVHRVSGDERYPVPRFVLADEESLAFLILTDDFWIGDGSNIGWLQLAQIPLLSLDAQSHLEIEMAIYVGAGASVAAVTDQLFNADPQISLETQEANTAIHLEREDGGSFSHLRIDDPGIAALHAPAGKYRLRHRASAKREVVHYFEVGSSDVKLAPLALPAPATVSLPRGAAMRLVFEGINGTESPDFADRLTDYNVADDEEEFRQDPLSQVFLAGIDSDPESVHLPAGDYKVYATRGLEFSLESAIIAAAAGETTELNIAIPRRVINTPGYIAADLHVHAGDSFDNTTSNEKRVRTFVAEHGEVMVNSEHDVAVDFRPLIKAMGVEDKVTSILGVEMTSLLISKEMPHTGGHVNFFPYLPQPLEYRNGMVKHEGKRLREVIHAVQQSNPGVITQLNHPRHDLRLSSGKPDDYEEIVDNGGYLEHMGIASAPYDPREPLTSDNNKVLIEPHPQTGMRDIDVDAIELVNPGGVNHAERIEAVRRDWFSFLLQGERITGTANSDSHRGSQQVAVPRNMIAVSDDNLNTFSRIEFLASIKRGDVYGTTGPFIEIDLSGARMGGVFAGNRAQLNLTLDSAPWVPLERVEIQINGETVHTLDASRQTTLQQDLEFSVDAIVTVEVFGPREGDYAKIYDELAPYAFTNPIYVDANADGQWQAPWTGQ